jgi:lambda family phage portal protein
MGAQARMRYRVKGTQLYFEPRASTAYETTGTGRRSVAMRAGNFGPNSALDYSSDSLRAQAREADRKNGLAKVISDRISANIVGTGIIPQPKSPKARALWTRWTDEASVDGTLDFYGMQAQIARALPTSGECFARFRVRRAQDRMSVPLQIQILESDYVPTNKNESLPGGGYIRQGIEFNAIGQRVAYWMYRQHPSDTQVIEGGFSSLPVRVPASEVMHIYDATSVRPGQARAVPWITPALAKLKDLDAYDDAELVRKKVSAMLVAFIRRNLPEGVTAEELATLWGDEDASTADGVGAVSMEPGSASYLEPGEEADWSNPQDVGGQYEVFKRDQHRLIASYTGLLYEQLTGDFSSLNDRTWRAAFNEFKRRCEMWQHHIIVYQFCRPVWARWTSLARVTGALRPAESQETVVWVPQAFPYINPKQDIEAAQAEIRAGLASRSQKASERGLDAMQIDTEQADDNRRADGMGLVHDSDGRSKKAGAAEAKPESSQPGDDEEDDQPGEGRRAA